MKSKLSALINYSATLLFAEKSSRWKNGREKKKALKYLSHENLALPVCVAFYFIISSFVSRRFYFELRKVKGLKVERAG